MAIKTTHLYIEKINIQIRRVYGKRKYINCDFCNTTPKIINDNIRKIDKTNLSYIKPHRIIIKNLKKISTIEKDDIDR